MLLTTRSLTKAYGSQVAVNGLDLDIERGSFTAILGPNGAGKSTTMGLLTGSLRPSSGTITYAPDTKVGIVFQDSVLDANLSVRENLTIHAKQYKNVEPGRITQLIKQLGLSTFTKQRYHTLSGGQRRRVDIARALLNEPDILYLDEPTTGLDIQTRNAIWVLLHDLQTQHQLTIVLTTHYLDEADSADSVYVVDHGRVIAHGTAATIKTKYAPDQLRITPVDSNRLRSRVSDSTFRVEGGDFVFEMKTAQEALKLLTNNQKLVQNFQFRPGTMDDAFIALTGKEVR
ncbi:ABC transporter ATP-binding protein [Secundilactobacillus yichangensis]|uniref:ABC transporter ATP-binding protein n=1 Tax=Secundilactobacillus yichangensis TaxID=2799580 RepID=UPI001940EF1F|nr:ABC transporter ATP-binding protein [Secundilactobacillus yichangensis]